MTFIYIVNYIYCLHKLENHRAWITNLIVNTIFRYKQVCCFWDKNWTPPLEQGQTSNLCTVLLRIDNYHQNKIKWVIFAQYFLRRFLKLHPIRNKNCYWWSCFLKINLRLFGKGHCKHNSCSLLLIGRVVLEEIIKMWNDTDDRPMENGRLQPRDGNN